MKLLALAAAIVLLTGCTRRVDATPVPQPQRIDCDLIFPGPGAA